MFSSLEADGLANAATHDFERVDAGGTVLCRVLDRPKFPGDAPGVQHRMLPVTHRCRKCGFEGRTDHPPAGGYGDCDIVVVRAVLET